MRILIEMCLDSDAIFGSGMSMPGGEDICVLVDEHGFPYMKGSTWKGIFREELINLLVWEQKSEQEIAETVKALMGESGSNDTSFRRQLIFSDLMLHPQVREAILEDSDITEKEIQEMFTYNRTFTSLEDGMAKKGSLRIARCVQKGYHFYGICTCMPGDEDLVKETLQLIKHVGTMRSRGFGHVTVRGEVIA